MLVGQLFYYFSTHLFHCIFITISVKIMEKITTSFFPTVRFHGKNGRHLRFTGIILKINYLLILTASL